MSWSIRFKVASSVLNCDDDEVRLGMGISPNSGEGDLTGPEGAG